MTFSSIPLPFKLYTPTVPEFLIIAHRGASAAAPENTMASFKKAHQLGALMIELDVTLSKDGVPVVIHDEKLNRTTNGKGKVADFTLAELKKLDAGSWFHSEFAGESIPALEEVLRFAKGKAALNIEIKPEAVGLGEKNEVEIKCFELVLNYGMQNHVLFSSFSYQAIENLRMLDADIPTALLYDRKQAAGKLPSEQVSEYQANAFNCNAKFLSAKWMNDLLMHNIPVFVYTVNNEKELQKFIEMGVSGIFTDKPDELLLHLSQGRGMSCI